MSEVFLGLNTRRASSDITDGESPDTANAFFSYGRIGQIGPRKGKTAGSPYGDVLSGRMRLLLPSGIVRSIVATNNGDVLEGEQSQVGGITNYLTGDAASGIAQSPASLVLTNPDTSGYTTSTFGGSETYDADDSIMISWGLAIAMVGVGAWSGSKEFRLHLGVNEGGVGRVLSTLKWTMDFSAGFTLVGMTPAAAHGGSGSILGAYWGLEWPDGWPTGSGVGDTVTISSLVAG